MTGDFCALNSKTTKKTYNMITTDQLKDVLEREDALRGYL